MGRGKIVFNGNFEGENGILVVLWNDGMVSMGYYTIYNLFDSRYNRGATLFERTKENQ